MSLLGRSAPAKTPATTPPERAARRCLASDMVLVHRVFRRELHLLPTLVGRVAADVGRAATLAAHCRELTTALRHHHVAEQELLWPRLAERGVLDGALRQRLGAWHREHAALLSELDGLLPLWVDTADPDLQAVLVDIMTELDHAVAAHLDVAETQVLPAVDEHFSTAEWLALGLRAAGWIPLHRMAWMLGAMLEDATPAERANLLGKVPAPARLLYRMVGQEQYVREMRLLRDAA